MEATSNYTPRMYRRIVFSAAQGVSFAEAAEALAELGELKLLPKRIWRAVQRIGEERVEECRAAAAKYEQLSLPARRQSPVEQVPRVACVQMDGGRFQKRERIAGETGSQRLAGEPDESDSATADDGFWREYKAGVLLSMVSQTHALDPCPELPATFVDPGKMREIAREIKGFTSESQVSVQADEEAGADFKERLGRPEMLVKSVVATSGDVAAFGPLLATAAYERGFHAAERKAFVADGSSTNWSVWRQYFAAYTPILDFVHALMYVYAGAMAGRAAHDGWLHYRDWAQWLWGGDVDRVLAALQQRQLELGVPDKKETGTPRAQVTSSLNYLTNQRERMKYQEYRQQGLPLTSSPIESTIKQINRRIKGTEKFWSDGADPMLHLVADRLSQTNVIDNFWSRRLDRLTQAASYHQAGQKTKRDLRPFR
ncbi:MAG: hypothetical protein IAF94_22365 [Pirellulaceae bacterium]|nr:hypothetical protein [Pirellulaceae bacterium]